MKVSEVPKFGNLSGVRVVVTGTCVAAPYAAFLMAQNGASVICLESTTAPDSARTSAVPLGFLCEHRNELALSLNLASADGQKIFLELMKNTDIFIEGYKGGAFAKLGLTDELLWEQNPALVITHVSGYGQSGDPDYVGRASYDMIGQAFAGYSSQNGEPGRGPIKVPFFTGDYITALFNCWSSLAAYTAALKTGKGESIDVSLYESLWSMQWDIPSRWLVQGVKVPRTGNASPVCLGVDNYRCKDGNEVALTLFAPGPIKGLVKILGVDPEEYKGMAAMWKGEERSERLNELLLKYCAEHTADEVDEVFNKHAIPCSKLNTIEDMETNSHAIARNLIVEWDDHRFGKLKGIGNFPVMKNRPGMFWRDAPGYNSDGRDILSELGYSEEEIEGFYAAGITKDLPNEGFSITEIKRRDNY